MRSDAPAAASVSSTERERVAAVVEVGSDGAIRQTTDAIEDLLGWRPDELIGRPLTTIVPDRFLLSHRRAFERFVDSGRLRHDGEPLALVALRADGSEVDIELILSLRTAADGELAVFGVIRMPQAMIDKPLDSDDVIERVRQQLIHLIAADRPLGEVLSAVLEPIGTALGWSIGVLWVFDPWVERMTAMSIWEREPGAHPGYVEATRHARFVSGEGFSEEMWQTQRPTWSSDLTNLSEFQRAHAARADGLESGIFVPIVAATGMIGIVELVDEGRTGIDAETNRGLSMIADELGQHLAERLRRETETIHSQRLQLAMTGGKMGMWTFHIPTGQVTWDAIVERAHGIEPGSFGGTFADFEARIHPDDLDRVLDIVQSAVTEERNYEFSYRSVGTDGSLRWVKGNGEPVFDSDGAMQLMVGVGIDATDEVLDRELLHRRATTAALAADVGRALVSDAPMAERLGRVVSAVEEHLDIALARIWTLDDGDDVLRMAASAGIYTHIDGAHSQIPLGAWKIGRIADARRPHVTNDVAHDDQISDPEWAAHERMQAFAGHPLMAQDRCVGVMGVFSRHVLTADVIGSLASITDSVAVAIAQHQETQRVRSLLEEARAQRELALRRLRERQHVASVLQASLLPPDLPEIPGLDVKAAYRSGIEEVGGDFYDLLPLGDDRWGFMIGDVCGSGPEAARFTALARHTLRTALLLGRSPADSLLALDHAVRAADTDGRFCTAVCGIVRPDPSGGVSVSLGVAGHPFPLVRRADGTVDEIGTTGPLLGVLPDAEFSDTSIAMASGDLLLLYTDGVVEARGENGFFGHDRLVRWLRDTTARTADSLTGELVDVVNRFDEMEIHDDVAILTIRRR